MITMTEPRVYILAEIDGFEQVIAGPFPITVDDPAEDALIACLRTHPWNDAPIYRCLMIDSAGEPMIEDYTEEYMNYLRSLAWEEEALDPADAVSVSDVPPEPIDLDQA